MGSDFKDFLKKEPKSKKERLIEARKPDLMKGVEELYLCAGLV